MDLEKNYPQLVKFLNFFSKIAGHPDSSLTSKVKKKINFQNFKSIILTFEIKNRLNY